MTGTVIGTGDHPVDLSDGRLVAPGEVVEDVDLNDPHQRALVTDGHLTVLDGKTARKAPTPQALIKAAATNAEAVRADADTKETNP